MSANNTSTGGRSTSKRTPSPGQPLIVRTPTWPPAPASPQTKARTPASTSAPSASAPAGQPATVNSLPRSPATGKVVLKRLDTQGKFSIEYIEVRGSTESWRKNILDPQGRVIINTLVLEAGNTVTNLNQPNFVFQGATLVADRSFAVNSQRVYMASVALVQTSTSQPRRVISIKLLKQIG